MCNHLEELKINDLFNDEIFDSTAPKLSEITIGDNKIELFNCNLSKGQFINSYF